MIDKFDYEEPRCLLCGGEDFYNPQNNRPLGRVPISRIIEKADSLFDKNEYEEAGRLLEYWLSEARSLHDKGGELSLLSELVGYYRKQNDREKGLAALSRALVLNDELAQSDMASGATVFVNCATAYKAFGMADKAIPLYERAKAVYEKVLTTADIRYGGLYNNMALALVDLGRTNEAERAYFSALDIMKKVENGEAEQAITYVNLAHMYDDCGREEQIKECMEKAYCLLMSENLTHDGYYAFVLDKCAPSFSYFGRDDIYKEMQKEIDRIYAGT